MSNKLHHEKKHPGPNKTKTNFVSFRENENKLRKTITGFKPFVKGRSHRGRETGVRHYSHRSHQIKIHFTIPFHQVQSQNQDVTEFSLYHSKIF